MTADPKFEEIMQFTRTVSSAAAFEDAECEAYFEILMGLSENARVVEVGLQFGRSSSIALQVATHRKLRYHGIDPFTDPPEAYWPWLKMASDIGVPFRLSKMPSNDVVVFYGDYIHAVLIDGDHSYDQVTDDCKHFLPAVAPGGYAMFHDFGRDSLPSVYNAVKDYVDGNPHWDEPRLAGTLAIFKRR